MQKISLNLRQCKVGRSYRDYKALRAKNISPCTFSDENTHATQKHAPNFWHLCLLQLPVGTPHWCLRTVENWFGEKKLVFCRSALASRNVCLCLKCIFDKNQLESIKILVQDLWLTQNHLINPCSALTLGVDFFRGEVSPELWQKCEHNFALPKLFWMCTIHSRSFITFSHVLQLHFRCEKWSVDALVQISFPSYVYQKESTKLEIPRPSYLSEWVRCLAQFVYNLRHAAFLPLDVQKNLNNAHVFSPSTQILRNHVMVRIGGGWDTLQNYLNRHDPCKCSSKGENLLS